MAAEVTVDFDSTTQSLNALNAAAYRLAGSATCQIDAVDGRYICHLIASKDDPESLRVRYLELVTDENVREHLNARTEPVRNLILALAFGALTQRPPDKP